MDKICTNPSGCQCAILWHGQPQQLERMQDKCVFYRYEKPACIVPIAGEPPSPLPCEVTEYKTREREQAARGYRMFRQAIQYLYWFLVSALILFIVVSAGSLGQ